MSRVEEVKVQPARADVEASVSSEHLATRDDGVMSERGLQRIEKKEQARILQLWVIVLY
jgi:hypothetical protein